MAASTSLVAAGCAARPGGPQSYLGGFVSERNISNTVFHWTDIILQAVRDQLLPPPLATRALAMGHMAGFLAANGVAPAYRTEIGFGPRGANADVAYGIACATAIAEHFQQPFFLDQSRFLAGFADGEAKRLGAEWGEKVGRYVVRQRTNDGAEPSKVNYYLRRYPRRTDALKWTPTAPFYDAGEGPAVRPTFHRPLLPGFGAVKPWSVSSPNQFGAETFLDPRSSEFADQFAEVKAIGGSESTIRTHDQEQIALFWEDGPWGASPPGHMIIIAMQLLQDRGMSLVELAKAFAMLSVAQADSAISVWHSKFQHDVIRPETAIRYRADTLGNPDPRVRTDPTWKSYIPTPPFPSYVSGHSAFGAAGARMLANILGTDRVNFSGPSPDLVIWPEHLDGVTRQWASLWQAAEENGMSRIYGGVHWMVDNTVALRMGRDVADHVFRNNYQPLA